MMPKQTNSAIAVLNVKGSRFIRLFRKFAQDGPNVVGEVGVVRALADDVIVMHCGRIEERGPTSDIFCALASPYTRALLNAMPRLINFPPTSSKTPVTAVP
ncbi:hypothetical protein [Phyllobacterium chamaecytisi]|uniref:hypothetical protein n=1 Tax=Phyllobacterium chamaecytisi TaxID=2876082 RepID=UPI001CC8FD7F|nr:hypothetical protein [Phyllobacterium sp. KW56]MBZ9605552.1 hypothetical protein [Phyllobacterium sp. KW56]